MVLLLEITGGNAAIRVSWAGRMGALLLYGELSQILCRTPNLPCQKSLRCFGVPLFVDSTRIIGNKHIDTATKVQAFMLVTYCNMSQRQAEKLTGVSAKTIRRYCEKAQVEGFDIDQNSVLYNQYFEEGKSSGRPPSSTTQIDERIAAYVRDSKSGREANLDILAHEFTLGRGAVARAMKRNKMRKVKPTKKPRLTEAMMAARLKFCLEHAD